MTLNELSKTIRFDNASKGFDPSEGGYRRYVLLTISEICEAHEELRDGHDPQYRYYAVHIDPTSNGLRKPEGFPVEIADAIIRLLDLGAKFDVDFSVEVNAPDFSEYDIDTWLLGIVKITAELYNWEPDTKDFQNILRQSLGSLFMLCDSYDIPIMDFVHEKLEYNRSRPPKHGRQF